MEWEYIIAIIGAALLIAAVVWALFDRHAGRIEALEAELDAERYQAAGVRRECDKRTLAIEKLRAQQRKAAAQNAALHAEIKRLTEREAELTDAVDAHSKRIDVVAQRQKNHREYVEDMRAGIQEQIDGVKTEVDRKIDSLKTDVAHQGERLSDMDEVTVALQVHEHDAVSAQAELIKRLTAQVNKFPPPTRG